MEETLTIFSCPEEPLPMVTFPDQKTNRQLVTQGGLLQYCQLVNNNSLYISRIILNCLPYFNLFLCLFYVFSRSPSRCSAVPKLGNIALKTNESYDGCCRL
jgi:hypothetical protein